ncbi:MAG TPA: M23 family metallopeptidase [Sphingomicrobium sp.]|nr:M23 family metallopeptidase [Sphingomicrobium sp.]
MRLSYLLCGSVLLAGAPLAAQSLKSDEILSTLAVRTLADAHPVLGSDNRVHLAYELIVTNPSKLFVTIDKVDAVDSAGKVLKSMSGTALAKMTTRFSGSDNLFGPGQTAIVFMDVSFPRGEAMPSGMMHRIGISRQSDQGGKPAAFPTGEPVGATASFTGAPVTIGAPARRIAAPLRGSGWVAANGCCDAITSHRGAVIAVNGKQNAPERFAIDWVQLDKNRKIYFGDGSKVTDFAYYGVPIYSVADGTVVNTFDGLDEQVPLKPAKGLTPAGIGGNMMVIDIGDGAYAFYAHMQRGSLKAKVGDKVTKGQVLGLLGNTGNTDAPHLHFHLMDGTIPLNSSGLPFVIDRFTSEGVLGDSGIDDLFDGKPVTINPQQRGDHVDQLPLNNEVSDFGPAPGR